MVSPITTDIRDLSLTGTKITATSAQIAELQSSLPTNVLLRIRLHHREFYTIALALFDMMT